MNDPYITFVVGFLFGLIAGILVCIPAKRKGGYYDK